MQEPAPVAPEEDASFAGGAAGLSEEASSSGAGRKRKGAGPEMVRANKKVRFQVFRTHKVHEQANHHCLCYLSIPHRETEQRTRLHGMCQTEPAGTYS